MNTCWSELVQDDRREILIENGEAFDIAQKENIPSLWSNQEETDSRIILFCIYATEQGYQYARVRSPDGDKFWILLYHASEVDIISSLIQVMATRSALLTLQIYLNTTQTKCVKRCWCYMHSPVVIRSALSGVLERLNLSSCY